jgi:hypothetical protein
MLQQKQHSMTMHRAAVAAMARELHQLLDTANTPVFGVDTAGRVNEMSGMTKQQKLLEFQVTRHLMKRSSKPSWYPTCALQCRRL